MFYYFHANQVVRKGTNTNNAITLTFTKFHLKHFVGIKYSRYSKENLNLTSTFMCQRHVEITQIFKESFLNRGQERWKDVYDSICSGVLLTPAKLLQRVNKAG